MTGEIKNQVDRIWDAFWEGGIANPIEVIEQITYLLFLRRLDEVQQVGELKATRLRLLMERAIYPDGKDPRGRPYVDLGWSRFKHFAPKEMFDVVAEHAKDNLPNVFARWISRTSDADRPRTAQSFVVPKSEIAANGYDLSLSRYKVVEHQEVEHRDPKEILAELWKLEEEIQKGMKELEAML